MNASNSLRQIISCPLDFDVDSTFAKICRYVPVLGAVVGIKRIAEAFFSHKFADSFCTRAFNLVRGGVELIGAGAVFLPVDFCLFLVKICFQKKAPSTSKIAREPTTPKPGQYFGDKEIIQKLQAQGFAYPQERGGGGRCLFLSIAPQIRERDLQSINMNFGAWEKLSLEGKADWLRFWAMENERAFISILSDDTYDCLEALDRQWIDEFYKDMIQELLHLSGRQAFEKMEREKLDAKARFFYVKTNFDEYYKKTRGPTNWAGSAEAISLARLFNRELQMFGQDNASSRSVQQDNSGYILPYCRYQGADPPIYVFQCNGGGHYQQLSRTM